MTLFDYINTNYKDKNKFFETLTSFNGLPYFGGKSRQIKELYNHIFNMMVQMNNDGNKCKVLVDAFAGGGKIGLTIPTYGWVDKIVINDKEDFIYSYYISSKKKPAALIEMIKRLGSLMCADMFYIMLYDLKYNNDSNINSDFDEVTKAAMIYWITKTSRDKHTDINAVYTLTSENEKAEIRNSIEFACKHIPELSKRLNKKNKTTGKDIYIIENMDYEKLINEYNSKNTLFYFDPPYYAYTLTGGNQAPYNTSFKPSDTEKMTQVLLNSNIDYFIKSDYDPKYTLKCKYKDKKEWKNKYTSFDKLVENLNLYTDDYTAYHLFDDLEKDPYGKILLGLYDKSTRDGTDKGHEYIWCKGFTPEYYTQST